MQSAWHVSIGLPSISTSAPRIVALVTPPEVSNSRIRPAYSHRYQPSARPAVPVRLMATRDVAQPG
jgi:hypothetical protein